MFLVKYDGEQDPGVGLMERFAVQGYPTLIAFDPDGKELDRQLGYAGLTNLVSWFREVPERAIPLDEFLKKAKASPKKGFLQVSAARRLIAAGRADDARAFWKAAASGSEPAYAAVAAWELGRVELVDQQGSARQKLAEKLAGKYPDTSEGEAAIRYLATLPKPPVALLETAIGKRMVALKDSAGELNSLGYIALRGGAFKVALKVADKLESLSAENPGQLDTVAEIHYMAGELDKAVAIETRALGMAKGGMAAGLKENLERFKRGGKELGPDVLAVRAPSMEPDKPAEKRSRSAPGMKAQATAARRLPDECGAVAGTADRVQAVMITMDKPAEHRIIVRPGTPKALAECVAKVCKAIEVTGGQMVRIDVALDPPALRDALKAAQDKAQTDCAAIADGAKVTVVEVVLSGEIGARPAVALGAGGPGLATCVDKSFAAVKLPAATLRTVTLSFGAKKTVAEAGAH